MSDCTCGKCGIDSKVYWTVNFYSNLAEQGWLYWCNQDKGTSVNERLSKGVILDRMEKYRPVDVWFADTHIGYNRLEEPINSHFPIFIKIEDLTILKKLGYLFSEQKLRVSMWELLDI